MHLVLIAMVNDAVSAVCKRCCRSAKSSEFVLDNEYGMMVCPSCVKERKDRMRNVQKQVAVEAEKAKEVEEAKYKPLPKTVQAYKNAYGRLPKGWPHKSA